MDKMSLSILLLLYQVAAVVGTNMNKGGVPYATSNGPGSTTNWKGTPGSYSTDFETNIKGNVEHFDVYGEVRTMYSQVYWTRNTPINLPPQLVSRFKGKVMAITGYEIDQVVHTGPQKGSTTTKDALGGFACYPDCEDGDQSVPIYNAYNHHYFSWLTGKDSEMYELQTPLKMPNPTRTAFRSKKNATHVFPTSIVFKENPGGEYRKSYHGYPSGFAQLIHTPTQWVVEPMQIDTHNRKYNITDQVGYRPWFMPTQLQNNITELNNELSPLIECPCTDRIVRTAINISSILTSGVCTRPLSSLNDCTYAIKSLGANVVTSETINDMAQPEGCIMKVLKTDETLYLQSLQSRQRLVLINAYAAVFNTAKSTTKCGDSSKAISLSGAANIGKLVQMNINVDHPSGVTLTLTGPADVWFGVGFDASAMKDQPYAIIVDGNGEVTERRLANHAPGTQLATTVTVVSNTVEDGVRSIVLKRDSKGATKSHYTFPNVPGDVNMIAAIGSGKDLAYHKARGGGKITFLPTDTDACVCIPSQKINLKYMNMSTQLMNNYDCYDEPRSDMRKHGDGTGRNVPNQACDMLTYHGGLRCCKHSWFLTDKEQDSLIPKDKVDTYFLKWRYYFQEYIPPTETSIASHKHLHHWVFLIDQQVNDYEEDNANYVQPSIGKITAHLTVRTMGLEDLGSHNDNGNIPPVPSNFTKVTPLVMTPHCHAPSCIREELWNADTNEIICNVTAMYGDTKYGVTTSVFNEKDYISIPPCIFGYQPGLQFPFNLSPQTNITAIKYFNNTYRHLGQMAQWTGLMVYDTDPY